MKDWFPFPPLYPTDTQPSPAVAALGCALCGKGQNKALAILIRRAKMNPLERWSDLTEYRAHIHDATQSKDHVFSHCKCHFFPKVQVCLIILTESEKATWYLKEWLSLAQSSARFQILKNISSFDIKKL